MYIAIPIVKYEMFLWHLGCNVTLKVFVQDKISILVGQRLYNLHRIEGGHAYIRICL